MDLDYLRAQMKISNDSIAEMNRLNNNYENFLTGMIKTVPEEHKKKIEDIRILTENVKVLAKEGKTKEAEELIKKFTDVSKNS